MGHLKIIIIFIIVLAIVSCKKNAPYEIPVRGNVRNNCTGKGFPDQTVMFSYDNKLFERTTDDNGDFDFGLVTVRPKDDKKFKLGIPNFSNDEFELSGITVILNQEDLGNYNQFGISATFNVLILNYPVMGDFDTLLFTANQHVLKKFEPQRLTEIKLKIFGIKDHYDFGINRYPMGWWNFKIDKYKSGIHSVVYDSIFIDMGETKTYSIPW